MKAKFYGRKKRTQKDKRIAALQFVVLSSKTKQEKVASLVASYGFNEMEAIGFVERHCKP